MKHAIVPYDARSAIVSADDMEEWMHAPMYAAALDILRVELGRLGTAQEGLAATVEDGVAAIQEGLAGLNSSLSHLGDTLDVIDARLSYRIDFSHEDEVN